MNRKLKLTALILLGVMFLIVLSSSGFCEEKSKKFPKFYLHKKSVELGEYFEGQDITHTYTFRNNGMEELHINVKPG